VKKASQALITIFVLCGLCLTSCASSDQTEDKKEKQVSLAEAAYSIWKMKELFREYSLHWKKNNFAVTRMGKLLPTLAYLAIPEKYVHVVTVMPTKVVMTAVSVKGYALTILVVLIATRLVV